MDRVCRRADLTLKLRTNFSRRLLDALTVIRLSPETFTSHMQCAKTICALCHSVSQMQLVLGKHKLPLVTDMRTSIMEGSQVSMIQTIVSPHRCGSLDYVKR